MPDYDPSLDPNSPESRIKARFDYEVGAETMAKNQPNQDTILNSPDIGLYGVFDGAGGAAGGAEASKAAMESVWGEYYANTTYFYHNADDQSQRLANALQQAGEAVDRATEGYTTAAVVKLVEGTHAEKPQILMATVGDSRVYVVGKDGMIRGLTIDNITADSDAEDRDAKHQKQQKFSAITHAEHLTDDEKVEFNDRNVIHSALGVDNPKPQVYLMDLEEGDTVIITSDGIHDNLTDAEIARLTVQTPGAAGLAKTLAEAAWQRAQYDSQHFRAKADDTTALVLKYTGSELKPTAANPVVHVEDGPDATRWLDDIETTRPRFSEFTPGALEKGEPRRYRLDSVPWPISLELADSTFQLDKITATDAAAAKYVISVPGKTAAEYLSGKYCMTFGAGEKIQLGRSMDTEKFPDLSPRVSRNHMEVEISDSALTLTDNNSSNGSRVSKEAEQK